MSSTVLKKFNIILKVYEKSVFFFALLSTFTIFSLLPSKELQACVFLLR